MICFVKRKGLILVVFLSTLVFAQQLGNAQGITPGYITYLSNSGEPLGGSVLYGSDAWIAQSFETGTAPDGYLLNGPVFIYGSADPASEFSFFSDNNGVPSVALGNSATFSPSTIYWLVGTASEPSQSSGGVQVIPKSWNYATDGNYSSSDNWSLLPAFALSSDDLNWISDTSHGPFQFAISGNPVPEPSVFALFGLALIGIFSHRRN